MEKKRWIRTIGVLFSAALIAWLGKKEMIPDFVAQDSWHLIDAGATSEGIEVKTAGENLMLHAGVKVKADSEESDAFLAYRVRDGITDEPSLRWSSANDWENNDHWLEVSFPEEETVGLVRIYWERTNALSYALECSEDGKNWQQAASFAEQPAGPVQDIVLEKPVRTKHLRLHVTDVAKKEEDLSLYYQNVSVLELEVYEGIEDSFLIENVEIPESTMRYLALEEGTDTGQGAALPGVPEGYEIRFVGADYEMLVTPDGKIADTIAAVPVELGFALVKDGISRELPGMTVTIPSSVPDTEETKIPAERCALPEGFHVSEWLPCGETCFLTDKMRVAVPEDCEETLLATAQLFAEELSDSLGREVETAVVKRGPEGEYERNPEDIYLYCEAEEGAQKAGTAGEAYSIRLYDASLGGMEISAQSPQGVRWGCVSFLSLLEETKGELPVGIIRDYPRYSVRGFGIDVGRRPVSLELLYRIVEEMSKQKMNTLQVHLNDNQIISQSGYDGTVKGARGLYAGFRLESELKNEKGEGITSADLYYTKEEFAKLVADAAVYGVDVVPEIDTPAHSLALTNAFPKLGLSGNPESVDQLDLSKPGAVQLTKDLWSEYLVGAADPQGMSGAALPADRPGNGAFSSCNAVHIGMDEYFGDEEEYISYLEEIAEYVGALAPDKEIRIWGSLSKIQADHSDVPKNLQMHIWDTSWADPQDMYDEGFSIINSLSSSLYIIPGGGYDWLDQDFLEENWQPNVFETQERSWTIPAYSPKMLGACYMMWNDWAKTNGDSITEDDLFARFEKPLPVIAKKLWGA